MTVAPRLGRFVWYANLGPGKVVAADGDRYRVEYFYSPSKKQTISQSAQQAVAYELPPKTRVYVELDDGWEAGQVKAAYRSRTGAAEYEVEFLH